VNLIFLSVGVFTKYLTDIGICCHYWHVNFTFSVCDFCTHACLLLM